MARYFALHKSHDEFAAALHAVASRPGEVDTAASRQLSQFLDLEDEDEVPEEFSLVRSLRHSACA